MQCRSRFLFLCKTSSEALLFFLILHVNLFCCCARNIVLYFLKPKEPSSIVPVALLVGRIRTNFCIRNLQYFMLRIYISSSCRASCRTSHGKLIISVPHSSGSAQPGPQSLQPLLVPFMCPCAEMDWWNWPGWKITFFLSLHVFSGGYVLCHGLPCVPTQWDKEADIWWGGRENDTGAILVFHIFTLVYLCGDSFCCKHKVKRKK